MISFATLPYPPILEMFQTESIAINYFLPAYNSCTIMYFLYFNTIPTIVYYTIIY